MGVILVTGCAGFIGSHICSHLLSQGKKVLGIDNLNDYYSSRLKVRNLVPLQAHKNFEFRQQCIGDLSGLMKISTSIDLVIHLAATPGVVPSLNQVQAYLDNNINKYNVLLDYMQIKGIKRLIFASSSSVYGNTPNGVESMVLQPISPYGFTKQMGEQLNYQYHYLHQISIVNLRLFSVYGERMRPDLALPKFMNSLLNNQAIDLYNNGNDYRDFTYIEDVVQAFMATINYLEQNAPCFQSINIGNNQPIKIRTLLSLLEEVSNRKAIYSNLKKRKGEVFRTAANISKAQLLLAYQPQTSIEEGIYKYYQWYQQQQEITPIPVGC
ncbi:NAD-dependent epimerase/dehydratase family protein [Aureispira anguillae]|uniref:NAD-dependent epimerase/dehydratase family protein n=1 Tax=Aureispira anguillae TaxID=2864201 RepID=A0A915YC51_9BACT|nr:NAD-dependent epimerase/dehydratase family protein [Aureispira anguillae]BDS10357.1 NAD-dependent epimerase/dehydratase family protein [Aureispira anguillae]